MATGQLPFKGNNTISLIVAISETQPIAPRKVNPSLPAELSNLILQLLDKDPEQRPEIDHVIAALSRLEERLASAPTGTDDEGAGGGKADDLENEIEEALWSTLSFAAKGVFIDIDELLKNYAFSVNQLFQAHREATDFFQVVCQTNLEFRSEGAVNEAARDEVLQNELVPMMAHCFLAPLPPDKVFTAHITELPLERAEAKLTQELRRKTRTLVQQFLLVCEKLVDAPISGLIEWTTNPGACKLHFFRKVVVQTHTRSEVVEGRKTVQMNGEVEKTSTAQSQIDEGTHGVSLFRYEHHLHSAECTEIDRAATIIPLPFQPLVKAMPSWLRGTFRLVTGIRFRCDVHEVPIKKGNWRQTKQLPDKEEFRNVPPVKVEYRTVADPAIVLGRYVFAGWGDAEIEGKCHREEQEVRERQEEMEAQSNREFIVHRVAFFLGIELFAALLLCSALMYSPSISWVGGVLALSGGWAVWSILRFVARMAAIRDQNQYYFHGFGAGISAAAVVHCLMLSVVFSSLGFACLAIMFLAACMVFIRQIQVLCRR